MTRLLTAALTAALLLPGAVNSSANAGPAVPGALASSVTGLTVSGAGTTVFPAFDPAVSRYAVASTSATSAVTVQVSTEPGATVRIDGVVAPEGSATLAGLSAGEEISVLVDDATTTTAYSLIYLPADFPVLSAVTSGAVTPGDVLLTLGLWTVPGAPYFEVAVDEHGVPVYVHESTGALDFKRLDNGHYTVARGQAVGGAVDIVELDDTFTEVARYQTVGLQNTDGHDSILLDDGSRYLMAYESDGAGNTDAIVQQISADGQVLFSWNSADHMNITGESVAPVPAPPGSSDYDYAHINSMQVMADGDLLLSFRHTSSVLKVARHAHDGYAEGDVVWRLGGRLSDFTFADGSGGPCAQHAARELPNGDIMVFDNGAWAPNPLCIDPADPSGPAVARTPTRVAVFSLQPPSGGSPGVATTVRDIRIDNRYAIFAGSAEQLPDDHVLIGWASGTVSSFAIATEVDSADNTVWELRLADESSGAPRYFTYRATKAVVPDAIKPEVTLDLPGNATYLRGASASAVVSCTDRGGSSLRTCDVTQVDTSELGSHQASVTATDGAGNTTAVVRDYTVVATPQPDAFVKRAGSRTLIGEGFYGGVTQQTLKAALPRGKQKVVAVVKVRNDGAVPARFRLEAVRKGHGLAITLLGMRARTPRLAPGESYTLRIELRRTRVTVAGRTATAQLRARSLREPAVADVARVQVKVR